MGLKRGRHTAIYALSCLLLAGAAVASSLGPQRLAVVVPAHAGDLTRAVSALDRWPTTCSPVTEVNVDLVLYYAEGEDDTEPLAALDAIASTAGKCFGDTKLVYANLTPEEDVYPKGPSVQFYKMFTDEDVKTSLQEYDALAIIEWDVLVASDRSFAELYRAAFSNAEDFWVKGSNIEGTNFHNTMAESSEMWHVMGHINGNAIYNNNDPMFGEFVEYTLARWEYRYPYDVALWATISDFPYSWPLWQRFSSKFVTTNLISNVGYEHIDSKTVSDAVAGETLFIHGSSVDNGNLAVLKATSASATEGSGVPRNQADDDLYCNEACGSDSAADSLAYGMSTVCDPTCTASGSRFGGYLCGAGDSAKFGAMCRMCYTAVDKAREAESSLDAGLHVIMCDTKRPPAAAACGDECSLKKDTVCDEACGTGVHGDYNCGWRGLGSKCRFCFNDIETALTADEVAKRHGGRVVMCDTHEPPIAAATVTEVVASAATMSRRLIPEEEAAATRELTQDEPKWKTNQKWKDTKKWQGDEENGILPKWKTNQKWKKNRCDDGCARTSTDGTKGRVCDESCDGGHPYGRLGCGAKNNMYGRYCRTCFNDVHLAKAADTAHDRAIMCDTVLPVTAYDHRQLSEATRELTEDEPKWKTNQKWKDTKKWQGDEENGILPKWRTNQKWKKNRCDEGCTRTSNDGTKGRVCDESCDGGHPYGRLGCGAKNNMYGRYCRTCFNDVDLAWAADTPYDRAIMCDTVLPVTAYDHRQLSEATRELTEDEPKWKTNQKWKDTKKWQGDEENGILPKWKTNQKWKKNRCDEGCTRTSNDGTKGRVCDKSCDGGHPYGRLGCGAKNNMYGRYCRTCFNDVDLAKAADTPYDRAIMCDTVLPVTAYDHRRLTDANRELTEDEPKWKTNQKWKDTKKWQGDEENGILPKWKTNQKWKKNRCDEGCTRTSNDGTKGRVCDESCDGGHPYGRLGCGAKNNMYGRYCRTCFNDVDLAKAADTPYDRAIMCDTVLPVTAYDHRRLTDANRELTEDEPKWKTNQKWKDTKKWQGDEENGILPKWKTNQKWKKNRCDDGCTRTSNDGTKGRVCDESCDGGHPYGRLGCGAKNNMYGRYCRTCFNDVDLAKAADTPYDRAIMCDTVLPVTAYDHRQLSEANRELTEAEPKWKTNQKWKDTKKWQGDEENGILPKWKTNQKWKKNRCDEGCARTSNDGTKGRVCDESCDGGHPYGRLGCGAKNNMYGRYCRTCFNDVDLAKAADTPYDRAIMCDTVEPVSAYQRHRQLVDVDEASEEPTAAVAVADEGETGSALAMRRSADRAFTGDVKRGEICAFVEGHADRVLQTDVTVQSILEFVPGVRVVVAAEPDSLAAYERTIGFYAELHTGVRISSTPNAHLSSLFADQHCGKGTKLILYVQPGSVLSRSFTSKDTHTPRGELLVVYGDARKSFLDAEIARETAAVLGFDAPSFTYGTDLMLPVGANAELRAELEASPLSEEELYDISSVPQLLAAHSYAQDTEGVHFVDPQAWVTQNLFKATSVWDIPLMKPRFACAIPNPTALPREDAMRADALERSLRFFRMGGSCENGLIAADSLQH